LATILDRLRSETRSSHERLEARVGVERESFRGTEYRDLLAALHGFFAPLERRIAVLAPDLPLATRAPLMGADLTALGASTPRECADVTRIESRAAALGVLYVLEGSALGARTVRTVLAPRIPEVLSRGSQWLDDGTERTGARWRQLVAVLEEQSRGCEDEVVAAARETFDKLEAWIARRAA
jgi:heme oxygenase